MAVKAGYCTPSLEAASIEKSLEFYERLGFETIDTDRCVPLGWARIHCEGGALMFVRSEEPVNPSAQAFILYMYTPDLAGLRDQLLAGGVKVPPIQYPHYMPSGEITLTDPDGYTVLIGHWGKAENDAWHQRIGRKA